jgi:hypothetical protein
VSLFHDMNDSILIAAGPAVFALISWMDRKGKEQGRSSQFSMTLA